MAVSEALAMPGPSGRARGRLDLDVAQRQGLDDQPAGQRHVVEGVRRVAQPQPEHPFQLAEHGDQPLPRPPLRVLERGGDPLARLAAAGGAERGDERHVQAPRHGLRQRRVVAGDRDPGDLAQQRPAALRRAEQAGVLAEDLPDVGEGPGVEDGPRAEPAARAGQVREQVIDVVLAVGPHPVNRAARHPGPLDDFLEPQVLDGERRAGLKGQFAPGVEHPLPDLFRRHPLRPGRHGLPHPSPHVG